MDAEEAVRSPETIPRVLQMLMVLKDVKDESYKFIDLTLRRMKDDMRNQSALRI